MKKFLMACSLAAVMAAPAMAATNDSNTAVYDAIAHGQWSQAESMLRAELAQNPHDAARLLNLAFVLQNSGRAGEAASVYQQVIQLDQNPMVAVDDPYRLSTPARAKHLARQGMLQLERTQR